MDKKKNGNTNPINHELKKNCHRGEV